MALFIACFVASRRVERGRRAAAVFLPFPKYRLDSNGWVLERHHIEKNGEAEGEENRGLGVSTCACGGIFDA